MDTFMLRKMKDGWWGCGGCIKARSFRPKMEDPMALKGSLYDSKLENKVAEQ